MAGFWKFLLWTFSLMLRICSSKMLKIKGVMSKNSLVAPFKNCLFLLPTAAGKYYFMRSKIWYKTKLSKHFDIGSFLEIPPLAWLALFSWSKIVPKYQFRFSNFDLLKKSNSFSRRKTKIALWKNPTFSLLFGKSDSLNQ